MDETWRNRSQKIQERREKLGEKEELRLRILTYLSVKVNCFISREPFRRKAKLLIKRLIQSDTVLQVAVYRTSLLPFAAVIENLDQANTKRIIRNICRANNAEATRFFSFSR